MTDEILILSIIAIVALIMGVISIKQWINNKNREHVIVIGNIVGFKKRRSRNGTYFYPVFEYYFNGQTYSAESNIGSSTIKKGKFVPMSKYKEGDEVEVRVFVDDPSEGIINTRGSVNVPLYAGVGALCIGALFAAVVVGIVLR